MAEGVAKTVSALKGLYETTVAAAVFCNGALIPGVDGDIRLARFPCLHPPLPGRTASTHRYPRS